MCQGCEDFMEFDRAVDAYIAKELREETQRHLSHIDPGFWTSGSDQ